MLLKFEAIPVQTRVIERTDKKVKFISDYSQRAEYVERTKQEWLTIARKLTDIANTYPESKWADDSLFCVFLFTKDFVRPPDEFDDIVIESLNKLIYSYPEIHLEAWTEKLFKKVFFKDFHYFLKSILTKKLSLNEKLSDMSRPR